MIFATIGTQAPFDRFVRIIDGIAATLDEEVVVQAFKDKYEPQNIKRVDFLAPDEFNKLFDKARMIVAHAGMGTIISAMQKGKPIIVFPRIAALGEHRNEHQMATARQMDKMKYVHVAYDEKQLCQLMLCADLQPLHKLSSSASQSLIDSLSEFIG
ncbi:MAG: glycosyl transferase family 28 [Muribaculaceae bacterium]|nr:glycosyl transferase family 28 [Muribaculaceae bacterium]